MTRPKEKDYTSQVAYTRALEAYCDSLPQLTQQEPVAWATQIGEYAHIKWGAKRPDYPIRYEVPLYTSPPPQRKPLTDEQIQEVVNKAVRERKLSWLGFTIDDQGEYTIPVLSPSDYQMARAIEAAHGIK